MDPPANVDSWAYSPSGCPVVRMEGTMVEFTDFPGWRLHGTNGGDSVAIALVKEVEA